MVVSFKGNGARARVSGGSIYEMVVVWPLWAASPPESVTAWTHGAIQAPFFQVLTPIYGLSGLGLAICSRWMAERQRKWAMLAGLSGAITLVWTMLFFVPILEKTQLTGGAGLSGEEITALVRRFWTWQWLRWVLLIGGWLCGLVALRHAPAVNAER